MKRKLVQQRQLPAGNEPLLRDRRGNSGCLDARHLQAHEVLTMTALACLALIAFLGPSLAGSGGSRAPQAKGLAASASIIQVEDEAISPEDDIHVVISSGCSVQQHWQSETLMWSWKNLNHPGKITRIVSGCKNFEAEVLFSQTSVTEANFFFTQDYTKMVNGKPCWFFNKPHGMREFIQKSGVKESVIILLDPDMTIVQPFDNHLPTSRLPVTEGHPAAASYGLDSRIFDWGICEGGDCSKKLNSAEKQSYMIGPPYILHRKDWEKMVDGWVDISGKAFDHAQGGGSESTTFVHTNAEMNGFILSSAQQNLRFRSDIKIMASDPNIGSHKEAWKLPEVVIMHYAHNYGHDSRSSVKYHRWSKHNHPHDLLINCKAWDYFDEEKYLHQWHDMQPKHKFTLEHSMIPVNRAVKAWRDMFGCGQLDAFCPYNDACHKKY